LGPPSLPDSIRILFRISTDKPGSVTGCFAAKLGQNMDDILVQILGIKIAVVIQKDLGEQNRILAQ
jgi:hypothetical protein